MEDQNTRVHDVAILLSALDAESAERLLHQLTPGEGALVRRALQNLPAVEADKRTRVVEEFMQSHRDRRTPRDTGVEFAGQLAERLSHTSRDVPSVCDAAKDPATLDHTKLPLAAVAAGEPSDPTTRAEQDDQTSQEPRPFHFLSAADMDRLVHYLENERPQTVAIVLSYLPPQQAAQLLSDLPDPLQVGVVERLADLDETDAESLRVVEREVEAWVDGQRRLHQRQQAGLSAVRGILSKVPAVAERVLLENLRLQNPALAERIAGPTDLPRPILPEQDVPSDGGCQDAIYEAETETPLPQWNWDDLARLGSTAWSEILQRATPEIVVLALAGASNALFERAVGGLPAADGAALAHARKHLGPTRLADVDAAQHALVLLAETLQRQRQLSVVRC